MNKSFTYSILKYRHSLLLEESLNLGLLFHFPDESTLHFIVGDEERIKAVYPNFDTSFFHALTRAFKRKLDSKLVPGDRPAPIYLKEYIQKILLPEDATALRFSEPATAVYHHGSPEKAIESFRRLFLPDHHSLKPEEQRHNEGYLIKKFAELISLRHVNIDRKMKKNRIVEENKLKITFDLSWQNGIEHLVKPVSFDLLHEQDIQDKSVRFFGYLNLLTGFAEKNECHFDLLVSPPRNPALHGSYEDAIARLQSSTAPLEVIPEQSIENYSENTAAILLNKPDVR
ncbi:MAG TPA: DUF3037 domain-containing protein [Puia sp.]|nr:DUF3037 domain-containing protein [Puia sp.]